MKLKRSGAALSVLAASTLLLSACGSDNNTGATGSTGSTGAGSTSNVECGGKSALKGSGSTAQANAMTRFVNAFEQACSGQTLNYTSNGSGAGVSEFIGNQTDIGGSDSPLSKDKGEYDRAKERCASDAWNLPVVFGPLAVTYNVKGVDDLVLDGPTAAKIFNGAITTWDDPAIKALNEGASLPSEKEPPLLVGSEFPVKWLIRSKA
ncbi:extracellular solute-binding protein, partial [Streptomyces sp. NPDC002130]|uniref:extracellular solute-binding protein n=1 Tax=Streptomyces sp. NPDC002130 TaxID=3155568 RepID=UPI00332BFD06